MAKNAKKKAVKKATKTNAKKTARKSAKLTVKTSLKAKSTSASSKSSGTKVKITTVTAKKTSPLKTPTRQTATANSTTSLVGKTVAPFSVLNSKGETLTHDSLKGHKAVLYFYPKNDTPGCTLEGQQFSNLVAEFLDADTVVFGVSKDTSDSHDKFICKYDLKIDLLSDEDGKLCKIFDVIKEKNMYGKKYMGIERSTFVLDANLKIVKEVRKVSPDGHAQEILEFVKSL